MLLVKKVEIPSELLSNTHLVLRLPREGIEPSFHLLDRGYSQPGLACLFGEFECWLHTHVLALVGVSW